VASLFGIGTQAKNPNSIRFSTLSRINKNNRTLHFTLNHYSLTYHQFRYYLKKHTQPS